jgi:hypothetical protein
VVSLTLYCSVEQSRSRLVLRRHLLGQLVAPVDFDHVDRDQFRVMALGQLASEVDYELIGWAAVQTEHGLLERRSWFRFRHSGEAYTGYD